MTAPHPDLLAVEEAIHASEGEAQTIRAVMDVVAPIVEERDQWRVVVPDLIEAADAAMEADPTAPEMWEHVRDFALAALDPEPPRGEEHDHHDDITGYPSSPEDDDQEEGPPHG